MGNEEFVHAPVMVDEVVDVLSAAPPGVIVDATVGGGSHAEAILDRAPQLRLVGLDQDLDAVDASRRRLERFGDRAIVLHRRFDELGAVVAEFDLAPLSGVLFDLGVSSPQLDRADRGFSYRTDAPLDMRMDRTTQTTAADLVNSLDERELANLLRRNADEAHASRIARAIVRERPVRTTGQLADVVRAAIPAPARRRGGQPATRTFQALRIEVNDELGVLPVALDAAIAHSGPGGRVAVLSYHSGEDRIVKARFKLAETGGCTCPPRLPCGCGAVAEARLLWRGARKPSAAELDVNPRSSAARFRAIELAATAVSPSPLEQPR